MAVKTLVHPLIYDSSENIDTFAEASAKKGSVDREEAERKREIIKTLK